MLGLKQHHLDFEILPIANAKKIVFIDASEYFEQPESPRLQIFLPGSSKYFLVDIEAQRVNTLNSHSIGLNDILLAEDSVKFPDGIYKFTYSVCPYKYVYKTKHILRTTQFDEELSKIYSKLDCTEDCIKKELIDIHVLIESAKANTALEFIDKGNKDFSIAQKKVNKLLDKLS